jgi:peptidoglycan/xylan/chitin deacetylase (PgdA/CDA1 family)
MTGRRMAGMLDVGLRYSPAQPFFRWRAADRLSVLAYHGVDRPEPFRQHLRYLRRSSHPVSLPDVLEAMAGRSALPRHAVLVTFDDGDRSVLDVALPLLVEQGIPAVAFVVAGLLDTDEPYWWEEVEALMTAGAAPSGNGGSTAPGVIRALKRVDDEERRATIDDLRAQRPELVIRRPHLRRSELGNLESAGVAVGNHSLTHPCLSRCSDGRLEREIEDGHEILSAALGHHPHVFAYPDGQWDRRAAGVLRRLGYESAFLFDHRPAALPVADAMAVPRLRVGSGASMDRFRTILSGLHPAIHRLRGLP